MEAISRRLNPKKTKLPLFFMTVASFIFFSSITADAQVSGIVVDSSTGLPISGAKVTLQATLTRTETALDGSFSLPGVSGSGLVIVGAQKTYFNGPVTISTPQNNIVISLDPVPVENDPNYNFVTPFQCAVCHPDQFSQWDNSRMAHTGLNSWVYDLYDGTGTTGGSGGFVYTRDSVHAGDAPDGSCASCHQPESWIAQPFTPLAPLSGPPTEGQERGVSCESCHKIADVDTANLNATGFIPGAVTVQRPDTNGSLQQVMFGLLGDADFVVENQMRGSFQPQMAAEACAVCHEYNSDPDHDNDFEEASSIPAQETYSEWKNSPYGDPNHALFQTCVDCHMPPTSTVPIDACQAIFPPLLRDPSTVHSHDIQGTTATYLENAVTLDIQAAQDGAELVVDATITNDQTGHSVPTGVTLRNMILRLIVTDNNGTVLNQVSGDTIHSLGGTGDPTEGFFAGQPGKLYAKINQDASGSEGVLFTEATSIVIDQRIPALGSDKIQARFDITGQNGPVDVQAKLIYRRAPRDLIAAKGWVTDGLGMPLADIQGPDFGALMESASLSIPITPPQTSPFAYRIPQIVADSNSSASTEIQIEQTSGTPIPCGGFSMGIGFDPILLTALSVNAGPELEALDGGNGPDFFEVSILTEGVTIACLFDFTLQSSLIFSPVVTVAQVEYEVLPAFPPSTGEIVSFVGSLGAPPVANVVATIAGDSIVPELFGTRLVLYQIPNFIRGDCNNDGTLDIGDPIFLLGVLFAGMTGNECDDALDSNDDGLIDIADSVRTLGFLFSSADPLPAPSACGTDPTTDGLDCQNSSCP